MQFRARYYGSYRNAIASLPSRADPSTDLSIQLGKIADALIGDKYCAPAPVASGGDAAAAAESVHNDETLERYVVAPYMFKQIVGKGHREFSSGRQQDASEYFQFLLDVLARCERTAMPRLTGSVNSEPTSALFTYAMEHRVEDASSHRVKYTSGPSDVDNLLELRIPVEVAVPVATAAVDEVEAKRMKMEANASSSDGRRNECPSLQSYLVYPPF
jgi:ubiquitin carboxyl-terminal hydrolase 5/13